MTLPVPIEELPPDIDPGDVDIQLLQAMDDCLQLLEHGPVWPLTTIAGWDMGHRLKSLLESMLATAEVDRRVRGRS